MQVRMYRDGEHLHVEVPTADGAHAVQIGYKRVAQSTKEEPVLLTMHDPHGSTVYERPFGELPLREQEMRTQRMTEEAIAQSEGARPPNTDPSQKTQADSSNVQAGARTAQSGLTEEQLGDQDTGPFQLKPSTETHPPGTLIHIGAPPPAPPQRSAPPSASSTSSQEEDKEPTDPNAGKGDEKPSPQKAETARTEASGNKPSRGNKPWARGDKK